LGAQGFDGDGIVEVARWGMLSCLVKNTEQLLTANTELALAA